MKKERISKILELLFEKPRTWKELRESLNVKDTVLKRYVDELKRKKIIGKTLNEDKIAYTLSPHRDPKEQDFMKEYYTDYTKYTIEVMKRLNKYGYFSKGMTEKDFIKFLIENKDLFNIDSEKEMIEELQKTQKLTYDHFVMLHNRLFRAMMGENPEIEIKFKMNMNPKERIKKLKRFIKEISAKK